MNSEIKIIPITGYSRDEAASLPQRRKVDFGLGEILKYFDEHFGKTVTKLFVALIGLAVTGVCLGLIWQHLLYPLYLGIDWLLADNHSRLPEINVIAAGLISGLLGILIFYGGVRLVGYFLDARLAKIQAECEKFIVTMEGRAREMDTREVLIEQARQEALRLLEKIGPTPPES